MKRRHHLKEIIVRADEQSLNDAIDEKKIGPENIVSVMLQPSNGLAVGDYEAKFRVLYRIQDLPPAASVHRTPPPSVRRKQRRRRSLSYRFAFSLRELLFNDCIVSFASFDPPKTTKLTTVGLLHPNVSVFIGQGRSGETRR